MIEVDEAYWRTVSLINKKKLAFKLKSLLEKLNRDVEAMLTEGVATKGDLLNVKVKLNEASLAFTRADNGVALSKMALFQLCGLDINGNYSLKDEDIEQAIINYKGNIDMARVLDNRPEIQQLEQLDNVAKSTLNIMKSRFMPNIAVAGNYIVSNPNVFNGFNSKFSGMFNASVVLNIPIFHFGDKVHTLRAAKSQKRIVEYKINEAKELITLQVTQSNFRINEANKKLESANSNIEAAEENLKLANEAYKEGLISISDLMAAQTAWASANSERIDAGIDVRLCELYLKRAKGEILENK
ncbi:MAG: TolC family protein, partial [Bacteroidales bacterium]